MGGHGTIVMASAAAFLTAMTAVVVSLRGAISTTMSPSYDMLIIGEIPEAVAMNKAAAAHMPNATQFGIDDGYAAIEEGSDTSRRSRHDLKPTPTQAVFSISDIDLRSDAQCGWKKCLYRSESNSSVGYLITLNNVSKLDVYGLALELERDFGIEHSYRSPPILHVFSREDAEKLRRRRVHSTRGYKVPGDRCSVFPGCQHNEDVSANVQPVQYVNMSEAVVAKSYGRHDKTTMRQVMAMARRAFMTKLMNRTAVRERIQRHVEATNRAMDEHPCLRKEMKIIAHDDGRITHLDLDKCFEMDEHHHESNHSFLPDLVSWYMLAFHYAEMETGRMAKWAMTMDEHENDSDIKNGTDLLSTLDTTGPVMCGWNKCSYRSTLDPSAGYIAGIEASLYMKYKVSMMAQKHKVTRPQLVYEYAQDLQRRFGINHTLSRPPERYRFAKQDVKKLTSTQVGPTAHGVPNNHNCTRFPYCPEEESDDSSNHFVAYMQPIKFVDTTSTTLVKCHAGKDIGKHARPGIRRMFQRAANTGVSVNRTAVMARITEHAHRATRMLEEEPCLWTDLQMLVSIDGTIMHLDFERCWLALDAYCPEFVDLLPIWYADAMDHLGIVNAKT